MDLKILGTGCTKCKKLEEATKTAAEELGVQYTIEKITDIEKIMAYSVMSTPALVVNGQVKVTGRVPSIEDIKKLIS
ncbi:MAG: TM0996/MTH895 family glutaredoxin-like protein [Bdellovibrionaceae bacterium]|nr:TM0996/MTH895 family glutaredoxin-like protein [Pseudobdellovibrionaceae bacterium]